MYSAHYAIHCTAQKTGHYIVHITECELCDSTAQNIMIKNLELNTVYCRED